jgi:catechol 2,3-dioxygenase-like lactoylglutathione lyase family enzyme
VAQRSTMGSRPIDPRVQIGHVHLKVADLERALRFYCGVLGFELMERHGNEAAFISAGGYHHHIGLNTWESAGGSPPPPGSTGLYHLAISLPDARRTRRRTSSSNISRNSARGRERSRRQRSPLSARSRPKRHRTLLRSPAGKMAEHTRWEDRHLHTPARFGRTACCSLDETFSSQRFDYRPLTIRDSSTPLGMTSC